MSYDNFDIEKNPRAGTFVELKVRGTQIHPFRRCPSLAAILEQTLRKHAYG